MDFLSVSDCFPPTDSIRLDSIINFIIIFVSYFLNGSGRFGSGRFRSVRFRSKRRSNAKPSVTDTATLATLATLAMPSAISPLNIYGRCRPVS